MKVVIFEGPRGSGKSSLIEDAFNHLTSMGKKVERYSLPGTMDSTKKMRELALKDSTLTLISRRLIQIAAGIEDSYNMEDIWAQSDLDYLFFDRSSNISNFIYGVLCYETNDEHTISMNANRLYNNIDSKIDDIKYIFTYSDPKTCIERIRKRNKEKDYMDLDLDEEKEEKLNLCYLELFSHFNDDAKNIYMKSILDKKTPWVTRILAEAPKEFSKIVSTYNFNNEVMKKKSIFLINSSTRKKP